MSTDIRDFEWAILKDGEPIAIFKDEMTADGFFQKTIPDDKYDDYDLQKVYVNFDSSANFSTQ